MLGRLLAAYERSNSQRPLITRTLAGTALYFVGDCGAQAAEGNEGFDAGRAARTCSWRALIHTPIVYHMYNFLDWVSAATDHMYPAAITFFQ